MARLSVGSKKDSAKQSRKELLKREDAFTVAAEGGALWAARNKKPLIVGAGVLFVAVVAVIVTDTVIESHTAQSATLFANATKAMTAKVAAPGEEAKPEGDQPVFASEHDRDIAARDAFEAVADAGGKSVMLARFMAADLTAKAGDKEAAEKQLAALLTEMPAGDSLRFLVVERLAYLQEGRGDVAGAIRTLETLKGDAFYADRAALQAARLMMTSGDAAKARAVLEKLKTDHAKTPVGAEASELLASMGVQPSAAAEVPSPASAKVD